MPNIIPGIDRDALRELLREAVEKQEMLRADPSWSMELIDRALPVLWFGNSRSGRPKIVTLAANPSRWEYLQKPLDPRRLREDPKNRLYVLREGIGEKPVTTEELDRAMDHFDGYFEKKPYKTWFGDKNGGKVEALVAGLNGSFYGVSAKRSGIHIDMFPFATVSDFGAISSIAAQDLFADRWAHRLMDRLLMLLQPEVVLVTGGTNLYHVRTYFPDLAVWQAPMKSPTFDKYSTMVTLGRLCNHDTPVIAISENLGNTNWNGPSIRLLGEWISQQIQLEEL